MDRQILFTFYIFGVREVYALLMWALAQPLPQLHFSPSTALITLYMYIRINKTEIVSDNDIQAIKHKSTAWYSGAMAFIMDTHVTKIAENELCRKT